jgi:hypothetical protein
VTSFNNPTERVIPVDHVINETDPNEPDSGRRGRVIVGALGGLAIGLLLATGAQQNSPDPEAAPSTITAPAAVPTVPTTTTVLAPSRLDILVDGYEGTLFLAGAVNQQGKLWRWESRTGTPLELDVPNTITGARFNASGVRVGILTRSGVSPLGVLWVGIPGSQEPLAVDVATWSWHADDPAQLAWIEVTNLNVEPQLSLKTATLPTGTQAVAPLEEGGEILLYDDSGIVIESLDETGFNIFTVDLEDGSEQARVPGRFLGQIPSGDLLVSQSGEMMRVSRDLTLIEPLEFPSEKRMAEVVASPVDQRWVTWEIEETTGVAAPAQLWIVDGEQVVFETTLPSTLRAVGWSHDGRWLVTTGGEPSPLSGFSTGELWFVDTTDWSMHAVDAPGFIFDVAAVP